MASKLKPGDVIHTCEGINLPIKEIAAVNIFAENSGRRLIVDFDVKTITGSCHSFIHCCTYPVPSKEEMENYFKGWVSTPEALAECEKYGLRHTRLIGEAILNGEDLFDSQGVPFERYHELKKARKL